MSNFNKLIEKNLKRLFFTSTKFSNILPKTSLTLCKMKLCSFKLLCELSTYVAVQKPFKVNSPPYSQWLTSACGVCLFDNVPIITGPDARVTRSLSQIEVK
jgi:hypothetical protein